MAKPSKIRISNLTQSSQISTQFGVLLPGASGVYNVDLLTGSARDELDALVDSGLISAEIIAGSSKVTAKSIVTPYNIYVSQTGNDDNVGTSDSPLRTIQAAINSLAGRIIQAKVTINVGPGSFKAFSIDGNQLPISPVSNPNVPVSATGLAIKGTWSIPVLTGGTVSGTATGASTNLATVMTDLGQAWTVDELRGKFVLSSSTYYPIISNTSTTMTVAHTAALSGAYSIWEPGTIIDDGTAFCSVGSGSTVSRIVITSVQVPSAADISISTLRISMDGLASGNSGLTVRNAALTADNISIYRTTGSSTTGMAVTSGSVVSLLRSSILHNDTTGTCVSAPVALRLFSCQNCYFRNGANGIAASANGASLFQMLSTTFEGQTSGVTASGGVVIQLSANGCRFINNTTALTIGQSTNNFPSALVASHGSTQTYFSGCGTILIGNINSVSSLAVCSGASNTNGIVIVKGARAQISNTATLGVSGNELSVDGTVGTLATLRAASPRVFPVVPNPYSTFVYE